MKIYDISMEISEGMGVWKNKAEKKPKINIIRTLKGGANESKLEIDSHTGTHADSYFHMLAKGATIEKIPLSKFIGNCIVIDFTKVKNKITIKEFNNIKNNKKIIIAKNDIVLLKTRNNALKKFNKNFTYLDKTGAKYLASKKIKLVGTDNLGIERDQPEHETHKILFEKKIPIIEGLELSKIKSGRYFFVGLPLKIRGGDAGLVRAALIEGLHRNKRIN